jgi:3-deoxy-D-manno-octulosonic-acid transferase
MQMLERVYTVGMRVARRISPALGSGEGKLARGIRGRRGAVERIEGWAAEHRRLGAALVWFHAPSVGEGFQARAVIEALRSKRPDVQVAYTFFSPSAESFAARAPVDVTDYLPLDIPEEMDRLLDALSPGAIVFSKTEVWPNLTERAALRGIPTFLLSATLPEGSSRLRGPARRLLSPAHARLSRVAAISGEDADRFAALSVPAANRTVMGDARFDQVWRRAASARDSESVARLRDPSRLTLVAGSTWPPDEERLIQAFAETASPRPSRLIIAPHEPTEDNLAGIEARVARWSLTSGRLGEAETSGAGARVIIVDRVGVLGDLYALADIAYVGGGFGNAGLHSILEPAAFGAPVIFGPKHSNAREAAGLIAAGGARSVIDGADLRSVLNVWTTDEGERLAAGSRAQSFVKQHLGAAERGADIILEGLPQ